jgi:hypothetical protein
LEAGAHEAAQHVQCNPLKTGGLIMPSRLALRSQLDLVAINAYGGRSAGPSNVIDLHTARP